MQPYDGQKFDQDQPDRVESIRAASRLLVRELGFMGSTLAGTELAPSQLHALIEIGRRGEMAAWELCEILLLDKSSVSRLLAKLVRRGFVATAKGGFVATAKGGLDARQKRLVLTEQGKRALSDIHARARERVETALALLPQDRQEEVESGLGAYAAALARARRSSLPPKSGMQAEIAFGLCPGALGRIVEMHGAYYAKHWCFGSFFEAKVASGLAEFQTRLDRPMNGLWLLQNQGRVMGAIAIDGEDLGAETAHLRWFIIDKALKGGGFGRRLLWTALSFADRLGFAKTRLWTFKGLDAARKLYEESGFELTEEFAGDQWGREVTEQIFERRHPGGGA